MSSPRVYWCAKALSVTIKYHRGLGDGSLAAWLILYTKTMKDFASKFTQTLLFNLATIAAIVVAIVQFAIRAWNENNGKEKTRKVIIQVLHWINTLTGKVYLLLNHDVPVKKVAQ